MDCAPLSMKAGPPTDGSPNPDDSTAIGPHASPIAALSISSRHPSEEETTTVTGDTGLRDGWSTQTSPIHDGDEVHEMQGIQCHNDTQKIAIKASLHGEDVRGDVVHAFGGAESHSVETQYPRALELDDAGRPGPGPGPGPHPAASRLVPFVGFNAKHTTALILSTALYLAEDKRFKGLVFAIIVVTVHSALCYFIALATSNTPQYTPKADHHKSHGSYMYSCIAQDVDNDSPLWAQIGFRDHVPRWQRGLVLTYVICAETFPTPDDAVFATSQLANAIAMWKGVGVTFKQVKRDDPANFRVVYRDLPQSGRRDVLAFAFVPNNGVPENRTLFIYALAFGKDYVNHQANFLAHEIGHVLGLRHEFSLETETASWSATWMSRSPNSVMKYYSDPSMWCVQQQDLDELQAFYDDPMIEYHNMPVRNFVPASIVYPTDSNPRYNVVKC